MLELYHDWRSFCSIKVRLCLAEKGLPWKSRFVDLMKLEHTKPEYLKLNPNGVVPTLVHNGIVIHESTVINEYLEEVFPDVPLMPKDPIERARARYWVKFEDDVLHPAIRPRTFAIMMSPELSKLSDKELDALIAVHPNKQRAEEYRRAAREQIDQEKVQAATQSVMLALEKLNRRLSETPWLGGDSYSLADVAAAPFIDRLWELKLTDLWVGKDAFHNWVDRVRARAAYVEAIPTDGQRFSAACLTGPH